MSQLADLKQLSFNEKWALLEARWDDLRQEPENIEVPAWHQEILNQREADVQVGRAVTLEWEEARG